MLLYMLLFIVVLLYRGGAWNDMTACIIEWVACWVFSKCLYIDEFNTV